MDFLKYAKENKERMLMDLTALLRIPSVRDDNDSSQEAPFGRPVRESLDYCLDLGQRLGFKVSNVENVAGHLEYGEGEEIFGILCHVDVVPAGRGWDYPPFAATIENGRIYARGAIDDKGPTISAIYAVKILKDLGFMPNKRVRIIIGTDEETSWQCIDKYLEVHQMPTLGFAPDADFPLIYGEKGIMSLQLSSQYNSKIIKNIKAGDRLNVVPDLATVSFKSTISEELKNTFKISEDTLELKFQGRSAHAMQPELGINAALELVKHLLYIETSPQFEFIAHAFADTRFTNLGLNFTDSEMGDLTVNLGKLDFSDETLNVGLNLRYPINWNKEEFLTKFTNAAEKANFSVTVTSDQDCHYVDKEDELVKTLHQAYIKYTNDTETPLKTIGGGTYARALDRAVAFGMTFPNREDVVHQANEYVIIDDLIIATAIYCEAIYNLTK